jgi:hypothetical protein
VVVDSVVLDVYEGGDRDEGHQAAPTVK